MGTAGEFFNLRYQQSSYQWPPRWMLPDPIASGHQTVEDFCRTILQNYDAMHQRAILFGDAHITEVSSAHQYARSFCRALRLRHMTPYEAYIRDDVQDSHYVGSIPNAAEQRLIAQYNVARRIESFLGGL